MFTDDSIQGYEEFEKFGIKKRAHSPTKEKIIEFKLINVLLDDLKL